MPKGGNEERKTANLERKKNAKTSQAKTDLCLFHILWPLLQMLLLLQTGLLKDL